MLFIEFNMLIQLFDIFKWYIAIQLLGIIGFILGYKIFQPLKYHGFCISKTFGLFLISTLIWFLCNQKLALISYSSASIYILLLIFLGFTYYWFLHIKNEVIDFISKNWKYLLYIELTFLIAFLVFVLLRTYTPNIEGTEKPLEFVVINSILRTDYLPPIDAWLSGYTINYYYLGQFMFCNLIKLTMIDSSIGFNLVNPTVLSLVLIGSFEFIYELTKKISWGILASFMTGLMGNLEPVVQIINNGLDAHAFRWWEAGHIIPNSFPEFPYWSFLHSDVHAHFLVHPFTIMFLFLMLTFIYSGNYLITLEDFKNRNKLALNTLYCTVLGSFMLINSWNYPSVIALTFAGLYIHCYLNLPKTSIIVNILRIFPPSLFYMLFSYLIYLAFYAYFTSPVQGLGIVEASTRTTLGQFLMLLSVFLLPVCVLLITEFVNKVILNKNLSLQNRISLAAIIIILIAIPFLATKSYVIVLSFVICLYFGIRLITRKQSAEQSIISAIMLLVFSLIITCELIYVNDLFTGEYERQNTVAKSYIQILLLLPIATSYLMFHISNNKYLNKTFNDVYIVTISILIILSSNFLWLGTYSKSNHFERVYNEENWHVPTLDGSYYIKVKYDGEYEGIMWLKEHATKNDVVLETEGAPYSHYGRVASQTGIPSLINWGGSLGVLRGEYFYIVSNPRYEAIKSIFHSINKRDILMLIYQYKISYIFIGPLERFDYTPEELAGFEREHDIFKKVFNKGNTTIYKVE